ncbi:glycosyltransferase family 2 protein [Leifsonia sp. YAF41]|uniref:glycosyltransferase family 2 protein n=1 Tax=Leifsonia sp. YAF41 TaxID=3233086 RepID=UPI003F9B97D9
MSRITAVVPTFNPDSTLIDRLDALAAQVDAVIVVDDGSPAHSGALLAEVEAHGYEVLRSSSNRGIAAALNAGTELALARGARYVLTMDQDSTIPDDYVAACLGAFEIASPETRLGVVCSDRINGMPSIPEAWTAEGLGLVREAIQSGFLISAECLRECGLFDEELFIDCVDTEFCLRINMLGYRIAVGPGTDIRHSLGERVPLRPCGIQLRRGGRAASYEYHGPVRRYFIARNNVDLYLRFATVKPRWVLSAIKREFSPTVTTIVSGPHGVRQLVATLVGATHGLIRKRGPIPPALRAILTPRRGAQSGASPSPANPPQ